MKSQIVIVPAKLTMPSLGRLLLLYFCNEIKECARFRASFTKPVEGVEEIQLEGAIINLMATVCRPYLDSKLEKIHPARRRWCHFFLFPHHDSKTYGDMKMLSKQFTVSYCDVPGFVKEFLALTEMHKEEDPWKFTQQSPWFVKFLELCKKYLVLPTKVEIPSGIETISLPFFDPKQMGIKTDRDIKGTAHVRLRKGRCLGLNKGHIAIGVVGPPDAGKSTLSVSLAERMSSVISDLKSHTGWEGLGVTIGRIDLDLGTPTADAIAAGVGQQRGMLQRIKQPWTLELAQEAIGRLRSELPNRTVTFCDLPGKVTDITRLMCAELDATIIITQIGLWEETMTATWRPLLKTLGVPYVSRISHRGLEETGFSSLASRWSPGERLSGRVSGLFRQVKSWDPFVTTLCPFLLYDILPNLFGDPRYVVEHT